MPQRLLLVGQSEEEVLGDDILKSDGPDVGRGAVVDEALPHLLVLVAAVVVGLHLPRHVVRVEMEPESSTRQQRRKYKTMTMTMMIKLSVHCLKDK